MKIRFISDLHLGHKNILKFSPSRGGVDMKTHSEWLVEQWNSVVAKNDLVWVLGDLAFDKAHLPYLKKMKGNKHLILGNHDTFSMEIYAPYFNKIMGLNKYKGFWLSHAPMHPGHLRGLPNIHGHLHNHDVMAPGPLATGNLNSVSKKDNRYINVSVERLDGKPISLEDIKGRYE